MILTVSALQSILGLTTQLFDGVLNLFAKIDSELNSSNSVVVGIHELPPGSPSFRPNSLMFKIGSALTPDIPVVHPTCPTDKISMSAIRKSIRIVERQLCGR